MTPLPLADRYSRFRDFVFSGVAEETSPTLPLGGVLPRREIEWQSLWFSGAFGSQFAGTQGERVRVVDFGVWNAGTGPDFMECVVEIDGCLKRGAIELDTDVRDWERHAHGSNPAYGAVVLHLFFEAPEQQFYTRTHDHQAVVQVRLSAAMLPSSIRPTPGLASARLGRCAVPLREMDHGKVGAILEAAAQYRLEQKSRLLHLSVSAQGRGQAVYQALARTLGYRNNADAFLMLSQRLPLRLLHVLKPERQEALLFGVSGFLERVKFEDTTPDTRAYLRGLWQEWWRLRDDWARWLVPDQLPPWRLGATRPGNHPQRRLGALVAMLFAWEQVAAPLLDAARWSQASWRECLSVLKHPFWSHHYTLLSAPAASPLALIGETRIHEMLANVVYPLLVPERTRLWAEYLELPAVLENQKVTRAALRLFGEADRSTSFQRMLHQQQGLLQLYEDFCLEDDSACANCPFPERLKEWS